MCNKVNAHQFIFKIFLITYVYLFTFRISGCWVKKYLNYCLHNSLQPLLLYHIVKDQINTPIRGKLACSMITISENATPRNSWRNGSSMQLWEARVSNFPFPFSFKCSVTQTWSVWVSQYHEHKWSSSYSKNFTYLLVITSSKLFHKTIIEL